MSKFEINGFEIHKNSKPYCIAEVGINHNGDIEKAKKMIAVAKGCGADAVKFQTFKALEFCGDPNQLFTYYSQGVEVTEPMLEMFQRYEFTIEQWKEIASYSQEIGITFFSTPQNHSDLKLLLEIGIPAIKIGSDDFVNLPLIKKYSNEEKPLILSCGMSDIAEVHQALEAAGWYAGQRVALLLCTSQYPTPPEDVNIAKLTTLKNAFPDLILGFSDHTQDSLAACLAASHGAKIFEKHFTLDNSLPGPDHWFSEDPEGLAKWVKDIHKAHTMVGSALIRPTVQEQEMRTLARRSVVAIMDIAAGELLTEANLGLRRPGNGLPPVIFEKVLGLKANKNIKKGTLLGLEDVSGA